MRFELPNATKLKEIGAELRFAMDDEYVKQVLTFMAPFGEAFNAVDGLPDHLPEVKYRRTAGYKPTGNENKHGAWYVKTTIKGASGGKLAGKKVAIKDTMCVAGVPMMNGASVLEGYIPDMDATIVTRLLDAGAEIVGKTVCEYFSVSGGSYTSASGVVHSPRNPGYTPGGSSTGSAALVAAGEVDMATGGDQAGSIRIPASYSGIVGIKPTYGLVPYTGIMGIEATIDHAGPLTRDVASNALFLEVLAGEDGLDSRQRVPADYRCRHLLDRGAKGLTIAVVREGFGHDNSEPDVDASVRAAAKRFERLGATVREVSIPMHRLGLAIWGPIALGGMYYTMLRGDGFGQNATGVYPTSLVEAMGKVAGRESEFPDTFRFGLLLARYTDAQYGSYFYAKAQNVRRQLRAAYDQVLTDHDILLMPTTPMKTSKIPEPGAPFLTVMKHCWEMIGNTAPFNVTGHPSISIPCGLGEGDRPIGLMLTGRHFDEATVYRAAYALEQSADWQTMR
jgi:amidase